MVNIFTEHGIYKTSSDILPVFDNISCVYEKNLAKAELLYGYLDSQSYYTAPADKKYRSLTTAVFVTGSAALDRKFIAEASALGLVNLEGHSSVGGMRAAIGTTVSYEAVSRLVDFMKSFSESNPKSFE